MSDIRASTFEDIPKLMPLLYEMHATSGLNLPPISKKKVVTALGDVMNTGLLLVAEIDKELIGVLALKNTEHWYSEHNFIADLVFYVKESARASDAAQRLIEIAKIAAMRVDMPLMMAVLSGVDVDLKDIFYEKQGLKRLGSLFGQGL